MTRNTSVCVNCPPQNRVGVAICSDPNLVCGTTVSDYIECFTSKAGGEPYACQTIDILGCGATSTPSPVPSPSPSPSPSPTPTPCPIALPSECPGGVPRDPCTNPDPPPPSGGNPSSNPDGCPFGYEVSGSCCIPIACPQPTPTPRHAARMRLRYSADLQSVNGQTASRPFLIQGQRQHHSIYRRASTIIGYGMCPTMAA